MRGRCSARLQPQPGPAAGGKRAAKFPCFFLFWGEEKRNALLVPAACGPAGHADPFLPSPCRGGIKKRGEEADKALSAPRRLRAPCQEPPGRRSHLPIATQQPLPGKCSRSCLYSASPPESPPGVTRRRCRSWCRCSLTSQAVGQLVFPGRHLQAGALCFQQRPARRGERWVLRGGCCGAGAWATVAALQVN